MRVLKPFRKLLRSKRQVQLIRPKMSTWKSRIQELPTKLPRKAPKLCSLKKIIKRWHRNLGMTDKNKNIYSEKVASKLI